MRAAVLGINDGLVTNVSLILGMVGAGAATREVQLAGLASLAAGACSMAIGEYVCMRAQVERLERLLAEERQAMSADPERERMILRETLQSHGFDAAATQEMSLRLVRDPERAQPILPGGPWGQS